MLIHTFTLAQRSPVEVAVQMLGLGAGLRPVPLDPVTSESLLDLTQYKGDGDVDENIVRGWWMDRPDATLGFLRPDGTVEPCSAEVAAEVDAALRQQALEKNAHRLTDLGNGARYEKRHGENARWCEAWGKWILWDGTRWLPDDRLKVVELCKNTALAIYDEVHDAIEDVKMAGDNKEAKEKAEKRLKALTKHAAASQRRERLVAMETLARSALAVVPDELDADGWSFNGLNGTLDLRTGDLRPHRREDFITKLAPVIYDAQAECSRWDRFLNEIMAGNQTLIDYLQRIVGMALTADVREQVLFVFHGQGANGKSVFLDTVSGVLGEYVAEAAPDLLIVRRNEEHPTQVADLCGKRLVVAAETMEGGRLQTNTMKRLTGNARLKARFMRQDYFEFVRTHKTILVTNSKPAIRESTHAVWRRIRLMPFDVVFSEAEQEKDLTERLRNEWSGILRWAVEGCLAWQQRGLETPEEVVDATQMYEDEEDVLVEFLAECVVLAANAQVTRPNLWAAYKDWCTRRRERWPLTRNAFYQNLRRRSGIEDTEKKVGGRKLRVFTGISIAAPEPPIGEPQEGGQPHLPY